MAAGISIIVFSILLIGTVQYFDTKRASDRYEAITDLINQGYHPLEARCSIDQRKSSVCDIYAIVQNPEFMQRIRNGMEDPEVTEKLREAIKQQ